MQSKAEILAVLEAGVDLTLATLMPDGAPHATTVSYANEGMAIYFGCAPTSQKAQNLARDDRVAMTITLPYKDWSEIRGLSARGRARRISPGAEMLRVAEVFLKKFSEVAKYVEQSPGEIALFAIELTETATLDYRLGFGHVDYARSGPSV
jgi:nitroimidazol reductase NimA-like FMN-containing flavoprotein (pyridoxamine 5'-phosphate oxidase superfamily)